MDDYTTPDISSLITGSWIVTVVSIVLGIGCIVACVYLAKQKGHDTVKAFTSGCVFGIFGVVYYLLAPESKSKSRENLLMQPAEAPLREAALPAAPVPPISPPAPLVQLPPVRCDYCGNVNPGDAQWCLGCGMNLNFDPSAPVVLDTSALRQASFSRLKWVLLAVAGIVLLAAAVVFLVAKV